MEKWKKLKDWILSPSWTVGLWANQPGCHHLMGMIMVSMGNIFEELYICFCSMDFTMAIILLGETLKLLDSPFPSKKGDASHSVSPEDQCYLRLCSPFSVVLLL